MKEKNAIALPFNWIFALIVGGVILFLAIYSTMKFLQSSEEVIATETTAKLIAILNPLESGFASKYQEINFDKKIRLDFSCSEFDNRPFGMHTLRFSEISKNEGEKLSIKNKYIFAENFIEGKNVFIFSKPFYLGYKISDLIMISSKDYCFFKAPETLKTEIKNLKIKNIKFEEENLNNCKGTKICFKENENCDISITFINDFEGIVKKEGKELYYVNNLIFGAIFSSPEIYECNVKRLKNKFNELALIYKEKMKLIKRNCRVSKIESELEKIRQIKINSSEDLLELNRIAEKIKKLNNQQPEGCEIW